VTKGPRTAALVVVIVASAVILRFWRLRWALDDHLYFPDEIVWFDRASRFVPLTWASFDLDFTRLYPTLYGYLAGLATAAAYAVGLVRPGEEGMFDAIFVARLVNATAGLASVVLVGLLAWRCFSAAIGLAAAAFMAVLPLEAMQAHYASVDSLLTGLFALTLLAGHALATRGTVASALVSGACVGLAFATKYNGLGALGALVVPLVVGGWRGGGWTTRVVALGAAVVAGIGFGVLVGCPPCVLRSSAMFEEMRGHFDITTSGDLQNARLVPSLGWVATPYLYELVVSFPSALGWPLWLLSLAGVAVALRRRSLADWMLLVAIATYFLPIGASPLMYPRYLLPMVPALLVLAARAGVDLAGRSSVGRAAVAAVWLYTFVLSAAHVSSISLAQQKEVAAWIAAQPGVRPGTRIATPRRGAEWYSLTPFLARAGLAPVVVADDAWLRAPADVFVVPELLAIGIRRDTPDGVLADQLLRIDAGEGGFRRAAHWPLAYFQRDLYSGLDPGLSPIFGPCGFTVYVRDRKPEIIR
jgi:hypothetical protein